MEDEAPDLVLAHPAQPLLGDDALCDRLCADAHRVEPASVIAYLDHHVAAFVPCRQRDLSGLRLAGATPLGRRLQAMIRTVAYHVRKRILDQLEHLAVELGVGADGDQLDLLAEVVRKIAHQPRHGVPGDADRLHPRLHDAFLQIAGELGQALHRRCEAAFAAGVAGGLGTTGGAKDL